MSTTVILKLEEVTYQRARRLADTQQQAVADALAAWIEATLPAEDGETIHEAVTAGESDEAVIREMAAYLELHPQLRTQYLGQYVAIRNGRLIDHDDSYDRLFDRIDVAFPDEFVWLTRVEQEPLTTLTYRSPRISSSAE
ncbi:MAG: hypothetical protein BroJett021_22760 [Chloroflexota bacterium]|nr:hypothetical protein [Caldilinea sp.]GIK73288.1 MAG: hypothetical protein BroJett021_22760 [Chloroflexota bacterium]